MGDQDEEKKEEVVDPRWEFLNNYLARTLKLKAEKWQKFASNEEYVGIINKFFNNPSIPYMLIYVNIAGILVAGLTFPNAAKNKIPYFFRKREEEITKDNYKDMMIIGEMPPKPVEDLLVLLEHVFKPMLQNSTNVSNWPQIVTTDLLEKTQSLKNSITQVQGSMRNQTILPMPFQHEKVMLEQIELSEENPDHDVDVELRAHLEEIVTEWDKMIRAVLNEKSTLAFANGRHPSPNEEIRFWDLRHKNLQHIYSQFQGEDIKNIASVLELGGSIFFEYFKKLFSDLVAALAEAADIILYLRPMSRHYEFFESNDFLDSKPLIRPMMYCTHLVWGNCKYYASPDKVIVLLTEINNMMMNECSKSLEPESMLQGEVDEGYKRVLKAEEILKYYRQVCNEYRGNLAQFCKDPDYKPPYEWNFHPSRIYSRFDIYLKRLELCKELLTTAVDFYRLEKVELAGIPGKTLGYKTVQMFPEPVSAGRVCLGKVARALEIAKYAADVHSL
ncbi:dynein beta chain, ciliary-like [Ctenocephalides felis]|uniref:dynein beta chain, ciliary-like n=1 Tax=Ctenocephalides felis TaxID=7515 RepID=UPI000E6E2651|nr:dynein beta chain, ciliary-like [Ctenocephalides felis]